MDDIFGEQNFITNIIWQKKYTQSNDAKYFSDTHDFILCYAKNEISGGLTLNALERTEEQNARYTNPDKDPRGDWKAIPLHAKSGASPRKVVFKNGMNWSPPPGTYNRYSDSTITEADQDNRIYYGKTSSSTPVMKKFLTDVGGIIPKTIWMYDEVGSNDDSRSTLKEIFSDNPFDSPKPVTLIQRIIQLSTNKDDIILDSFAGSGTTAHAVLDLNKEDNGNRKFILVEMENYADNITTERVRRVINGIPNAKDGKLKKGLSGTFSYFELGKAIEMEEMLSGKNMPSYQELARYIFYTATGEEFDETKVDENKNFIGESKEFEVYLFYKPDLGYLKATALTLDRAHKLGQFSDKKRLVFAPTKYLDQNYLDELHIEFAQLPFEIYTKL